MIERIFYKVDLRQIACVALATLATSALGDPGQSDSKASPAPAQSSYIIVSHIGEADQQVPLQEDKLLARSRTIDPFGVAIRGKFKGLLGEKRPAKSPAEVIKPAAPELTLEKAIQQLPIGAVNIGNREALIGVRSIHEGDLLVLELSGYRFVVWVESIDRRGVQFCDINLRNHALKPFHFGPTELPQNSAPTLSPKSSAAGETNVRDFLK
jgi:hypothetical protein